MTSASFAGAPSGDVQAATLAFRPELRHEGKETVAHVALVEGLLELGLASEPDLACRGGPHQGGEVFLLGGRETGRVEVALLPLEEPNPPGKRDKDATRLGARDLAFASLHLEWRLPVHVPEGPFQADRVLAASPGGFPYPSVGEALDPLVNTALARGVLPEVGDLEPALPMEVPVHDPCRVEVVHGDSEFPGVRNPDLPAPPQVGRALERAVLPLFGELGDLARRPRVFVDRQIHGVLVVQVAQRVSRRGDPAYEHLAKGASFWSRPYPRGESLAGGRREARRAQRLRCFRQAAPPASPRGRGRR